MMSLKPRPSSIVTLMEQNHTEEPSGRAYSSWIPSSTLHSKSLKKNGLPLFTNAGAVKKRLQTDRTVNGEVKGNSFHPEHMHTQKVKRCGAHHSLTRDKPSEQPAGQGLAAGAGSRSPWSGTTGKSRAR